MKSVFDYRPVAAVYTLYVVTVAFPWMLVVFLGTLIGMPTLGYRRTNHYIAAPGMALVLKLIFVRLTITREPDFDPTQPSVYCFNHVNVLDAHTACSTITQPFVGLMKASHFKIPIYGWVMKHTQGIPVFPRSSGRTAEVTAAAKHRASLGLSILTFPEAHRTMDGAVRPFRTGVLFMARDAGLPVIPVAVSGMYRIQHKGTRLFRPGRVHVYVGPQISTEGLDDEGIRALAVSLHEWVSERVDTHPAPATV